MGRPDFQESSQFKKDYVMRYSVYVHASKTLLK